MRADLDGRARKVRCPECNAAPGKNCVSIHGNPFTGDIVHRERTAASDYRPADCPCAWAQKDGIGPWFIFIPYPSCPHHGDTDG